MAKGMIDIFMIYQFLRRLVTPFDQWEAFKTGVIDAEGHVIVDKGDRTSEQDNSWGYFDRLTANLKKLLNKIPGGKSRIGTFAAALLLIKEHNIDCDDASLLKEKLNFYLSEAKLLTEEGEIPTNTAGSGNVDGIGIGPKGEPGVRKKKKALITDILSRKK